MKTLFLSTNDDLIVGMQRELRAHDKKQGMNNLVKAVEYLHSAMDIFEETGFNSKADKILSILSKIAVDPDHHTKNLTSDKMVKNLKQHGHPLNLADDNLADDLLNVDIDNGMLEVIEDDGQDKTFEDSD